MYSCGCISNTTCIQLAMNMYVFISICEIGMSRVLVLRAIQSGLAICANTYQEVMFASDSCLITIVLHSIQTYFEFIFIIAGCMYMHFPLLVYDYYSVNINLFLFSVMAAAKSSFSACGSFCITSYKFGKTLTVSNWNCCFLWPTLYEVIHCSWGCLHTCLLSEEYNCFYRYKNTIVFTDIDSVEKNKLLHHNVAISFRYRNKCVSKKCAKNWVVFHANNNKKTAKQVSCCSHYL